MTRLALVAGLTCALAVAASAAQTTGSAGTPDTKQRPAEPAGSATATQAGTGKVAAADLAFAKEAAMGGMAEVELGRLAADKGANADVKQFGQRMVDDHGKANGELTSWASQNNVTLPTELDAKHTALRDKLSKLSGDAFDKAYMREMVADHNKDVAAFQKASHSVSNADLKAWASKTLPTLQEHQRMAKEISSTVNAGAKK